MLGSAERSRQSSELWSLGGEADLDQFSPIANNLQSATDTPPDLVDESELLPLKQGALVVEAEPVETLSIAINQSTTDAALDLLDASEPLPLKLRSLGVKTETVEHLSIASLPIYQSTTDVAPDLLNLSEELPLKRQSLGVKAETITSPSDLQSASLFLDLSEEFPLTLQQNEAISRRHHLKFITGHYGSGKVKVSST